jgi:hypothetical protein
MRRFLLLGSLGVFVSAGAVSLSGCGCQSGGTNACTAVGPSLKDSKALVKAPDRDAKDKTPRVQGGGNGQ